MDKIEYRVEIPEEEYSVMEWEESELPCVAMINSALKDFEPKIVFSWHLVVEIDLHELIDNGMPSQEEREIVDPFCDQLDKEIKFGGNALFLARETWNGLRTYIWRVYSPEIANEHLKYLLEYKKYPRPFEYRMEQDKEWEKAQWYVDQMEI